MQLTLQKYILKEFFRVFIPTIIAFEFLLILGLTLQSMHKGANVMSIIVGLLPYFVFYALPYALPTALLAATVITYGRMSGDNEIWAMLTSGIHISTIIIPIAILGILFSMVSVAINAELLPRSYKMLRTVRDRATKQVVQHLVSSGGKLKMDPYYINIQEIEGDIFKNITILKAEGDHVTNIIMAKEGRLDIELDDNVIVCALHDGEFVSISGTKASDSPTVIPFSDTTFLMPLGLREHKTMRKYMPFMQLLEYKKEVKREIRKHRDILGDLGMGRKVLGRQRHAIQVEADQVQARIVQASTQAEKAREVISLQRVNMVNIKNDIRISQDYIRISEESVEELVLAKEMVQAGKTSKPEELASIELKISEVNRTIEDETIRMLEAEEAKLQARETTEKEEEKLASLAGEMEVLSKESRGINERLQKAARLTQVAEHQETTRDINVAIHKRLSPGLSCLAFVLIGIPVGIMIRMGNTVIGLFISFGIALVVYYPLLIAGESLARKQGLPAAPAMWAANVILGIIAIVLLYRLFRR